jgi:hypothetical protein
MRILVAFEDKYRVYRGVIAAAIRVLRPRAEVVVVGLDALVNEVARFDPHLVICSQPNTVDPGGRPAWVELPVDPTRPTRACVGGRYSESRNPLLDELLSIIDDVERLVGTEREPTGC